MEHNNFALSIKSISSISPSDNRFDRVISKITRFFSFLTRGSFKKASKDFSYISIFTFVTGLKLPLIVKIFFLYNSAAGKMLFPSLLNITACVIPFFINCKLINLLSIFLKRGPLKLIVSISIASLSI